MTTNKPLIQVCIKVPSHIVEYNEWNGEEYLPVSSEYVQSLLDETKTGEPAFEAELCFGSTEKTWDQINCDPCILTDVG